MTKAERLLFVERVMGTLSVVALIGSGIFSHWGWGENLKDGGCAKLAQVVIVALWTVLPPMWFWIEFTWLYKPAYPISDTHRFEAFKHQQDLSSKIWLAAISALLMLYFWKDIAKA